MTTIKPEVPTPSEKMTSEEFLAYAKTYFSQYRSLPPVPRKIQSAQIKDMEVDEHQALAILSDLHYGQKIDAVATGGLAEYNLDIARSRLIKWRNAVLRLTQLAQVTIKKLEVLHIAALGDMFEGNGMMFKTQGLHMDATPYFQVMPFVEDMSNVLVNFLSRYERVVIHVVGGNHGFMVSSHKERNQPDNYELLAWHILKERLEAAYPGRFIFNIEPSFFVLARLMGHLFLFRHGDGIGGLTQTYTGVQMNKLMLNAVFGLVINYYVSGHHHEASAIEAEIDGETIKNGSFVGGSELSVKGNRAKSNRPSQEFYLLHRDRGIAQRFRIHLATVAEMRKFKIWEMPVGGHR